MISLDLEPVSGVLGAIVRDVDLSAAMDAEMTQAIRAAFVEHQVLFFRDQDLDADQQIAFGRRFGDLDEHPFVYGNETHPEILDVITTVDDTLNFGGGWHTDVTFLPEPDLGSILYAVEVPDVGGDTLFANQQAAYDALSDTMKSMLEGLSAVHSAGSQYTDGGLSTQSKEMRTRNSDLAGHEVEHPVIRTHPESGRKGLYVNKGFTTRIRGLRRNESDALLGFLFEHAVHERFTCRFRWQQGSVAMWDNRSVQHFALHDYAGKRRQMRRITICGDTPV